VSKWKELGRVGKRFSLLKRLISSGLLIPFDEMEDKYPTFWDKGIKRIVLKEIQGRGTQATRHFGICYVSVQLKDMVTNESCFIRNWTSEKVELEGKRL